MNKYMNNLFRIYRRRYGGLRELVRTDEGHRFWAVIEGQPICSRKTVYNLENGRHETDDDTVAFLVGKLGYRYENNPEPLKEMTGLAVKVRQALLEGNGCEME